MSKPLRFTNFRWYRNTFREDILVRDGMVIFPEFGMDEFEVIDCKQKILLPAFVDSHCHILPTGLDLKKLNLGGCDTREQVLDAVRDRDREQPEGFLLAVHYDQNKWGGEHLDRLQLDAISLSRPILLRHVNGHAGIANSNALEAAGLALDAADPTGGSFGRNEDGLLNGVLFENALEAVSSVIPKPTVDEMAQAILLAGQSMYDFGICSASDMQTGSFDLEQELTAYLLAAQLGNPISCRLYINWKNLFGKRAIPQERLNEHLQELAKYGVRLGGVKIFADGAIGSATAAIYGTYAGQVSTGEGVSGQLIYSPERLKAMVNEASDAGYQVATHAIGDYAVDLVMDAYEATGRASDHRLEHAMILSDKQIERLAALDIQLCMQPEFLQRFAKSYLNQLGADRAALLNRYFSLRDEGVRLSFSSDRPIVSGNPLGAIESAINRPSPYSASENISLEEAIYAYTAASAEVQGDAENFGKLQPGEQALGLLLEEDAFTTTGFKQTAWLLENSKHG